MFLTLLLLFIYIGSLIYVGIKDHNTEDADGFIIADRKVGILGTLTSNSVSFHEGGGLVFWVGTGFLLGYGYYAIFLGYIIAFGLLSIFAPKIRQLAKKKNYITMTQVVKDVVGHKTEKLIATFILLGMVLWLSAQFFVLGGMLSVFMGLDPKVSVFIVALIVSFYVSLGGYKSIIKTDIIQFFIIMSVFLVVFFIPLNIKDSLDFSTIYRSHPWFETLSIGVYGIFGTICCPEFWQRIFSSKDDRSARLGIRFVPLTLLLFAIPLTLLGLSARNVMPLDSNPDEILMLILQNPAYPNFMISILILAVVSMSMSTLDTYTYVFSSTMLEDVLKIDIKKNKKRYIYLSKFITVIVLAVSAIFSFFMRENFIALLLGISGLFLVVTPLFFGIGAGLIKKAKGLDNLMFWSLLIPFAIGVIDLIIGDLSYTFARIIIPALISTLLIIISWVALKLKKA